MSYSWDEDEDDLHVRFPPPNRGRPPVIYGEAPYRPAAPYYAPHHAAGGYLVPNASIPRRARSTGHRPSDPGPAPVIVNNRIYNVEDDQPHYLAAAPPRRRSRSRSYSRRSSHSRHSSRSSHGDYEIERIRERARLEAQMQVQLDTMRNKDQLSERVRAEARREYGELQREKEIQDRELDRAREKTRREVEMEMMQEKQRREYEQDKARDRARREYEHESSRARKIREDAENEKAKKELAAFKAEKEREAEERRIKEELELKRLKEEKKKAEEKERAKKEAEKAVEEFKIKEAEKRAKEKKEKEERDKEYARRLEEDLRKSGIDERQIALITKKKEPIDPSRPTYTRMSRKHLSIETLRAHRIDYEFDQDPDYILIKRWVPEYEQDILWTHTRTIRKHRHPTMLALEGRRHRHGDTEFEWVKKEKKTRKPSPSPLLTFLAGGSSTRR
ncbi:hypothetical protein HYALB_00009258 [Hymenoscyphus albidus]|uniref:DUF8035 domain-containing protein n=1 Tax=Hymenoscyphus albidus TaxID=595503 RepID=A0A9N9LX39_9HELO|nr:hypothetical protein HYALB_00009258 [Hymenoscyphus albidus]